MSGCCKFTEDGLDFEGIGVAGLLEEDCDCQKTYKCELRRHPRAPGAAVREELSAVWDVGTYTADNSFAGAAGTTAVARAS